MFCSWLGHFYAVNLLYPLLRKTSKMPNTPAPRIVMESSEMHRPAQVSTVHYGSMEEINDETTDPTILYARTKLAMILGMKRLVEKVIKPNGDNIYALTVHPGAVSSKSNTLWRL